MQIDGETRMDMQTDGETTMDMQTDGEPRCNRTTAMVLSNDLLFI
jgi:hypothetical protein